MRALVVVTGDPSGDVLHDGDLRGEEWFRPLKKGLGRSCSCAILSSTDWIGAHPNQGDRQP